MVIPSDWWQHTFTERGDALEALFGPSQPPGTEPGSIYPLDLSCPGGRPELALPGVALQLFPPTATRPGWFYLTLGFSQPIDQDTTWPARWLAKDDPEGLSGYGAEFGLILPDPQPWVPDLFTELLTYILSTAPVRAGHRVPFGFQADQPGYWLLGSPDMLGVSPTDQTRGLLFWPYLTKPQITTSTGKFDLLIGTGITEDESGLLQFYGPAHLMLLLQTAGLAQQTIPGRPSIAADPQWQAEWQRIETLDAAAARDELAKTTPR